MTSKGNGCFRIGFLSLFMVFFAALLCSVSLAASPNVVRHTPDEIRSYIAANAPTTTAVTYQTEPVTTAPYAVGRLSDETLDNALRQLNIQRYIAGVNPNVVLSERHNGLAQAATLANAVNGQLSHNPARPDGMDDEMYQQCQEGAKSTNIAFGYVNLIQATRGWMDDEDSYNIDRVGHRRWMLNPTMSVVGFGATGRYYAVACHDGNGSGTQTGVCWPAQEMPIDYFGAAIPWSCSVGTAVDTSAVHVTLTRRADGKSWNFGAGAADGVFYVNNDLYGQTGCIIFRPSDAGRYYNGDVFDVSITGISPEISYTVEFFSLEPLTSLTYANEVYKVRKGNRGYPSLSSEPSSGISESRIIYTSSDESIATVDESGYVTGVGRGKATITASCGQVSASCEIWVTEPISDAEITFPETVTYTGSALNPDFEVMFDGTKLTPDEDYTISSWSNNTAASTQTSPAKVTITGKDLFTGTRTAEFTILPADINDIEASVTDSTSRIYTGLEITVSTGQIQTSFNGNSVSSTNYDLSFRDNVEAGTATVVLTGKKNFTGTKDIPFTIYPRPITDYYVKAVYEDGSSTCSMPYTGDPAEPGVKVTYAHSSVSQDLAEDTDYELSYENNVNAGTGKVIISGKKNFTDTKTLTFTILKASLTGALVSDIPEQTYTGAAIRPEPEVILDGKKLTIDTDYTLSYSNNINSSDYSGRDAILTVTGKGNYSGSIQKTFRINPASVEDTAIELKEDTITYTGMALRPAFVVKLGENTIMSTHYTATYSNNINAGKGTIRLTGQNNLTGETEFTFTISPASLENAVIGTVTRTIFYTGKALTPELSVRLGEQTLTAEKDYTAVYSQNINAGTARVEITGKGNYTGTASGSFTIWRADIGNAKVEEIAPVTYNGYKHEPEPKLTFNGIAMEAVTDYVAGYENNIDAGEAAILLKGAGNFTGEMTVSFTIELASIKTAVVTGIENAVYTGKAITQALTVLLGKTELKEDTDYTVSYQDNTNAGTATVMIKGIGNYSGEVSRTFTIKPALAGSLVFDVDEAVYNGSEQEPKVIAMLGKAVMNPSDYTLVYSNNINAGKGMIKLTGRNNLTGETELSFIIKPRSLENAVIGTAVKTVIFSGKERTPELTVQVDGLSLKAEKDYTAVYFNNINAGTAYVEITGKGNYKDKATGSFTIEKADITGAKAEDIDPVKYTGQEHRPEPVLNFNDLLLIAGTDYTISYKNNINAGDAAAVVSGIGNFRGDKTVPFTISPVSIEAADVTGISDAVYTGSAITRDLTVTLDGTVLEKDRDFTAEYTDNINAGMAKVTVTGKGNYTGSAGSLTFTIEKGSLENATIGAIPDQTMTGSGITPAVTVTWGSLVLEQGRDYTVSYTDNVVIGTAAVTVKAIEDSNFIGEKTASFAIVEKTQPVNPGNNGGDNGDPGNNGGTGDGAGMGDIGGSAGTSGTSAEAPVSPTSQFAGPVGEGANAQEALKVMEEIPARKDDVEGMSFGLLQATCGKVTSNAITIRWKKVPGAVSYIVLGNKCGQKYQELKTVGGNSFKFTKLKKGTYYKAVIIAVDAQGKVIATSKSIHVATSEGKVGNDRKVAVSKKKVTLRPGKSFKIKASAVAPSGVKVKRHRKVSFETSNPEVAVVNAKGKVTAKKKGKCVIYCYAQDGVYAKVTVNVR